MTPKKMAYHTIMPVVRYFYGIAWRFEKGYFLVIPLSIALTGLSPFINIIMPKYIIDELLSAKRIEVLAIYVIVLVGLNLITANAKSLTTYFMEKYQIRLSQKYDEILAKKTLTMDFAHTENAETLGTLMAAQRGMSWYSGGIGGLTSNITGLISSIFTFVGTIYIIGLISPVLLVVIVILAGFNSILVSKMQNASSKFMKDMVDITRKFTYYSKLLRDFKFGKEIRIYNAAEMIDKRTEKYLNEEWSLQLKWISKQNKFIAGSTAFGAAQQALLYGYLGIRVLAMAITIGEFQMLIATATSFAGSLARIIESIINLAKTTDFMNAYCEFIKLPDNQANGKQQVESGAKHTVEFRNVSFMYPNAETYSLRNISLKLHYGEKLSVVGQNGAGKTTFIKLLCRLYDPTEGDILLNGVNINQLDISSYRQILSVVFQDYKLLALSIKENITATENADICKLHEAISRAGLDERLSKLKNGCETSVYKNFDSFGVEFSGGESQKMAIARAIYKDAQITILDEPTAALDPLAEYDIYTHFDKLIGNKTAIYISHRLSSCRFCDRIAVFKNGEIVQYGTHNELVNDEGGEYANMWNAQAQYYK
jgi:ATP-binding cassette subfamily B protein/ATP-binding cassette subfamily C protein